MPSPRARAGRATLLVVAWLAFAVSLFVALPARRAEAADCAGHHIPLTSMDGWSFKSFATGAAQTAFVASGTTSATLTVVASGAAPAAATASLSGGTVLLAGAAFIASFAGTCKALDWVVGDGARELPTWDPPTGQTQSLAQCPQGLAPASTEHWCHTIGWGSLSAPAKRAITNTPLGSSQTYNGVTLPAPGGTQDEYNVTVGVGSQFRSNDGTTWCPVTSTASTCTVARSDPGSIVVSHHCAGGLQGSSIDDTLGGVCGVAPGALLAVVDGTTLCATPNTGCSQIRAAWPVSQQANSFGWQRRLRTQTDCRLPNGTLYYAVDWSPPYWDRMVDQRIDSPACPSGAIPLRFRTWRVTVNGGNDPWGSSGNGLDWSPTVVTSMSPPTATGTQAASVRMVWDQAAPAGWATGSAPAWALCLASGANCGEPEIVNGTCVWGGYASPGMCGTIALEPDADAQPRLNPSVPRTEPSTGTTTDGTLAEPEAQPPTSTTQPPTSTTQPPTTTTQPGQGAGFPSATGDAECMPTGWGWFNPIEWVLEPIKCAFRWAFIPDEVELDERFDALTGLRENPPLQWVDEGVTWVSASSVVFVDWASAGPACTTILDVDVCPRDWDSDSLMPSWVSAMFVAAMWFVLVRAIAWYL